MPDKKKSATANIKTYNRARKADPKGRLSSADINKFIDTIASRLDPGGRGDKLSVEAKKSVKRPRLAKRTR